MPGKKKSQLSKMGRPLAYQHIVDKLKPEVIYSAASIAIFAIENHLVDAQTPEEKKAAGNRIRVSFNRIVHLRDFPDEGDGDVVIKGQAPVRGWKGKRWQENYPLAHNGKTAKSRKRERRREEAK